MPVVNPFELPTIAPREGPLPELPGDLPDIADKMHVARIAERVEVHYARQRRWKPCKSKNRELLAAIQWVDQNLPTWPPSLVKALAYALGVYDRIENRKMARRAAMYDGRADVIQQSGMKDAFKGLNGSRFSKPTAARLSNGLQAITSSELGTLLLDELPPGERSIDLTADLVRKVQTKARVQNPVHVSPRKVEAWRSSPSYQERREAAKQEWLEFFRGKRKPWWKRKDQSLEPEHPGDFLDDRAAEWAVASGKLTSDERLIVFMCVWGMNRRDRMLTPRQLRALAGALRLAPIGPQKVRAAGHK